MELRVAPSVLPGIEAEMAAHGPWMHPYRLGPSTVTGSFKHHGIGESFCTTASPPDLVARMNAAFDEYMSGAPFAIVDEALRRVGPVRSALDIACATGRFSFRLALSGQVGKTLGVEIRDEQIAQSRLLKRADDRLAALPVDFEHEPESADAPAFRASESYDLVLSMGLLYHLADPLQHLRNLARLTNRAAVVFTLTHRQLRGAWKLAFEDPAGITKATQGVSWTPHFADMPNWLQACGFARVETIFHPEVRTTMEHLLSLAGESGVPPRVRRRLTERGLARRLPELQTRSINPGYVAYLAWRSECDMSERSIAARR